MLWLSTNVQNIANDLFPGIKYDAEKEEKQLQEARQRKLQQIETKLSAGDQGLASALILKYIYIEICVSSTVLSENMLLRAALIFLLAKLEEAICGEKALFLSSCGPVHLFSKRFKM